MLYLALTLANSASALLLPANPGRVAKVHMAAAEPAAPVETNPFPTPAYEGLVLPYETGRMNDNINKKVNDEVNPFLFGIGGGSPKLAGGLTPTPTGLKNLGSTGVFMKAIVDKGLLKSDPHSLDELQKFVRAGLDKQNAAAMPGLAPMPDDYNFFGGDDLAAQLCVILESNPFYASSLTPRAGGGFEIINFVCYAARARTPDSQTPGRGLLSLLLTRLNPVPSTGPGGHGPAVQRKDPAHDGSAGAPSELPVLCQARGWPEDRWLRCL